LQLIRNDDKYREKLPTALAKDYGKSDVYLPAQVKATVERNQLSQAHLVYALAMFCTSEAYDSYCKEHGLEVEFAYTKVVVDRTLKNKNFGHSTADLSVSSSVGVTSSGYGDSAGDGGGGGE